MQVPKAVGWTIAVVCVAALVVVAAISAHDSAGSADARSKLTVYAPAAPGGGWDLVAREAQQAMRTDGIVKNVQVVNVPGAGGTIGLGQLSQKTGDGGALMVTGTVMMGGIVRNDSAVDLSQMTPIARVAEDFEVIAVPANSELKSMADLVAAWKASPHTFPIGGGSAGGIDHMIAGLLARSAGLPAADIRYAAYAGGGELTGKLLSDAPGTPEVGISGFNDFRDLIEDGRLRALMVVAPERLTGVESVPTAAEAGFPEVDLVNWRGFVAPPGLSEDQQGTLIEMVEEMVKTEGWQAAVTRNRWKENWLAGDRFHTFLVEEQKRITGILQDLGLA
ncbi:MAG: tripartite tricarboxylate transporter substrate-binding protein [Gordonia sp. (in: high G+C Gram-positive bacteria)]|uniref:Bug family tripartite tricarboxylate transporter substrate binding protein n=1 Tax=Gordonia sp. (in: high G+C Gram-positive bacteria) TaxID=84139 RepID=UPI0039E52152